MDHIQEDYLKYYLFLKSNARRGVNALRSILADGTQARAFAENPAAVAVVLSYDKDNPDKNAVELYDILAKSSVAETASLTYLCNTYGVASFAELFANGEVMAEVLADGTSMSAITASRTAMESIVSDEDASANVARSETALCAIAGSALALEIALGSEVLTSALESSSAAMDIILSTETSWAVFAASESAMALVWETDVALGKVIASKAGLDHALYSDFNALAADSSGFGAVLSSSDLVAELASSAFALNRITRSGAARAAWMSGPYAQTYYSTIYSTLHNAPSDLFTKYEARYSSAIANTSFDQDGGYTNKSGGITHVEGTDYSGDAFSDVTGATEFNGLTLFVGQTNSSWYVKLWSISGQVLVGTDLQSNANKVCMGGAAFSVYYKSSGNGYPAFKYATYVAV